jgi:hypothetical protein
MEISIITNHFYYKEDFVDYDYLNKIYLQNIFYECNEITEQLNYKLCRIDIHNKQIFDNLYINNFGNFITLNRLNLKYYIHEC